MLYKYIGNKLKINDDTIVSNGDILTVRLDKDTKVDGPITTSVINSCNIINNRTGKEIPNAMNFYTERIKDLEPLDIDAGDIDEVEETAVIEDKVNHPSHYTWLKQLCGIEVIDITRHMDFDLGNAIKYILRCGHKEELGYSNKEKTIEDLRKAIFYINDKIEMLERQ
ncbi:MAG: DUF3310 domain-containing protein [Terrisporobacter sp.]|uniref:DUF3310 domain-containing protein n=1 Tax=Terrisporobacter sp. TaxID=1965305 RepID=UPI002A9161D3|nr:DUF3310 domain-containing protein [Terrisporobacter sp.]MDY6154220.1 DUF3310 domain-containing protein [Terrisporobacter sp.]